MKRWSALFALACLGASAIGITSARTAPAQVLQDSTSLARTPTPPPPAPIPAAEITISADRTRAQIHVVEARSVSPPSLARVDSSFIALTEHADFRAALAATERLAELSMGQIADLELDWQRVATRFAAWSATLKEDAKRLERDLDALEVHHAEWQVTIDSAKAEELPPAALQTALAVLADIERAQRKVRGTRDHLVSMQKRIGDESAAVESARQLLAGAAQAARRRMLHRDGPPIWRIWATDVASFRYMADPLQHIHRLRRYISNNNLRSGGQILLFFAVLSAMIWVKRQSQRMDLASPPRGGPSIPVGHVLEHPFSSTLLLTFIATVLIHPLAPQGLRTLGTLVAILPLSRLAPEVLPHGLGRASHSLLLLYFLANLVGALVHEPIPRRLCFLAINALAAAGLAHLLRSRSKVRAGQGRPWRATLAVLQGALWILTAALVANALGFVTLSVWLSYNTLRVIFAGLALLVAAATIDGLIVLALRTQAAQRSRAIRLNHEAITRRATGLVNLAAGLIWVATALHRFELLDPVSDGLRGILTRPLHIGSIAVALGDILLFFFILWLSVTVSRIVRQLLRDDILSRVSLPRGVADTISQMVYYAVVALGFLFAIAAAGIDMNRFAILAGAFGVGIGFGLQNIVNNFISGLILLFERPIQSGDTVELDNLIGTVRAIGIRASRVRTFDGADVIVPNADLISGRVVNWTLSDRLRRIDVKVGVAYGTDPTRVKDLLANVATSHPNVLAAPPPVALFTGFGDSSLDFVLRFWTADFENWLIVSSDVATAVHDAIREAGIEIPFPQRDLHLRTVAPEARNAFESPHPAEE